MLTVRFGIEPRTWLTGFATRKSRGFLPKNTRVHSYQETCQIEREQVGPVPAPKGTMAVSPPCKKCNQVDWAPKGSCRNCDKIRRIKRLDENRNLPCPKCGKVDKFPQGTCRPCGNAYTIANQERIQKYTAQWKLKNKERLRELRLVKQFGITEAKYAEMLAQQLGRCALCPATRFDSRWERLAVDHCHTSGKIRRLLCARCNLLIGNSGEDDALLERMASYIREHRV